MRRHAVAVTLLGAVLALLLPACTSGGTTGAGGGFQTLLPIAAKSPTPAAPRSTIKVAIGDTTENQMYIHLSSPQAAAGTVTFQVTNEGSMTHEFVVLKTDTPAGDFPIGSFEGESDRIDEDAVGENVGETGDMAPGTTKTLRIDLGTGHYAVVCNLPGHYRAGMHQDLQVVASGAPPSAITVALGETSPTEMYIHLSSATAGAGKVTFTVTNEGTHTHEFVVLKTDTPAGDFPIGSFEGESDRIDEDAVGENVGETGDMAPGTTKTLRIDLGTGHYAVVCNLPGHYRAGMHQDLMVV